MRISLLLVIAVSCGSPSSDDAPETGCVTRARTCAEVVAAFAAAGTSASVTCDETAAVFTMRSSGIPPYPSGQTTPNAIDDQGWVVALPLAPGCAAAPTSVVASRGPVGFMVNGVAFFGPQNANGQDAPTVEGPTLDDCDGHADMQCTYHYHSSARCVFGRGESVAAHAEADGHPALLGFGLDGFPLHAAYEGAPSSALDECNGHVDATRGYHHHATATSPYFIGCHRGTPVVPQATDRGCD